MDRLHSQLDSRYVRRKLGDLCGLPYHGFYVFSSVSFPFTYEHEQRPQISVTSIN